MHERPVCYERPIWNNPSALGRTDSSKEIGGGTKPDSSLVHEQVTVIKVDGNKVAVTALTDEERAMAVALESGVSTKQDKPISGGSFASVLAGLDLDSLPSGNQASPEPKAEASTEAAAPPEQANSADGDVADLLETAAEVKGTAELAEEAADKLPDLASEAATKPPQTPAVTDDSIISPETTADNLAKSAASEDPSKEASAAPVELPSDMKTVAEAVAAPEASSESMPTVAESVAEPMASTPGSEEAPPPPTPDNIQQDKLDEAVESAAASAVPRETASDLPSEVEITPKEPVEQPVQPETVPQAIADAAAGPGVPEAIAEGIVEAAPDAKPEPPPPAPPAPSGGVSAAAVKALREESGAGMMDCKKALKECDGDVAAAKDWLRKKGLASAGKKAGRIAAEGLVVSYIHAGSRLGVLAEVNCETDFVARGDVFKQFAQDVAMQVAACPDVTIVAPEDFPADQLAKEKEIEMSKEDLASKPENIREKIVQGRLDKLCNQQALVSQPYIKDDSKTLSELTKETIAAVGENITIRRFTRYNLGEGIEKKSADFAEEVAQQMEKKDDAPKPSPPPPQTSAPEASDAPAVQVSAKAVKELREMTGCGMMDCKKALSQNDNDIQAAQEWLRKKGLASAGKKAGRVASEGAVGNYIHIGSRLGVLIEVNCETDFVSKGDMFKNLVKDMAMQVAACPDVQFVSTVDVDPAFVESEMALELQKEDLQSKPENLRPKIAEGRVQKQIAEKCLLNQAYIKDPSKTVEEVVKEAIAAIGENIQVRRFERFNLGEGLEKKQDDFVSEVAAATGAA